MLTPSRYLFPPRTATCVPPEHAAHYLEAHWTLQYKHNDTRIIIRINDNPNQSNTIEVWNRHAKQIQLPPEIDLTPLLDHYTPGTILDGGLLHNKHRAIKNTIILWDILAINGQYLIGTTYAHRQTLLPTPTNHWEWNGHWIGENLTESIKLATNHSHDNYTNMWNTIHKINEDYDQPLLEGIVMKDPNGTLEFGYKEKNNLDWSAKTRVMTGRHRF